MKARVFCELPSVASWAAVRLEGVGFTEVETDLRPGGAVSLRYGRAVSTSVVARAQAGLLPFRPSPTLAADLRGADLELTLGDSRPLSAWEVRLYCDSNPLMGAVREFCTEVGLRSLGDQLVMVERDRLAYGGASPWARQLLLWFLAQRDIVGVAEEKAWSDSDDDIYLSMRDPVEARKPAEERFEVEIRTDDPDAAVALLERLGQAGFQRVQTLPMSQVEAEGAVIGLTVGPFRSSMASSRLQVAIADLMDERGVSGERYPLRVEDGTPSDFRAVVTLPLRACLSGRRPPYAGPFPERFRVTVATDEPGAMSRLVHRLRETGFSQVRVTIGDEDDLLGAPLTMACGALAGYPELLASLQAALGDHLSALGAPPGTTFGCERGDESSDEVEVCFPSRGLADGSLLARAASPARWELTLRAGDTSAYGPLFAELRSWGFKSASMVDESFYEDGEARIAFGGAPLPLVDRIRGCVRSMTGLDAVPTKEWDASDDDIWLYLPAHPAAESEAAPAAVAGGTDEGPDLSQWLAAEEEGDAEPPPLVEASASAVRVGEVVLPRRTGPRHALAPELASFGHYCLDQVTAATLVHVASSVALAEPCLLEGETSTSKTSSIQLLAALLDQPLVRLNLNGQTDTGELVGRFVPQQLSTDLPVGLDELGAAEELLEQETVMIVTRARQEGRPLTRLEAQQVMANERMRPQPWRWQDGLVVRAMRQGWWVVLDELNLAEPQILERLNSVLEREPSLVLTEHDNSVLGPGGEPVHPDFRVFATMNPAEYAGRSVLSPAYRNRWRGYRLVPRPGEREYLEMLGLLVHGRQPEVTVLGRRYRGSSQAAPYAGLAATPEVAALLPSLARFHAGLEHASGQTTGAAARIGVRRKERYVFTRRDLLSVVEYLASPLADPTAAPPVFALRRAIARYYLERVAAGEDRQLVLRLLDAAGLGPGHAATSPAPGPYSRPSR